MNKTTKHQSGFTVVEFLIIIVVLAVIGGVGYLVYKKHHKTDKTTTASAKQTAPQPAKSDPYAGWKSYTSDLGGFSVKYPASGWTITAYGDDGSKATGSAVTANESHFAINEDIGQGSTTSNLQYSVSMDVEGNLSAIGQDNGALNYRLGSVQKTLNNGIQLWQTSEDTFNTSSVPKCGDNGIVMIKAASDNHLYATLPNGKYLNFTAGFCNGPLQQLTQGYQQQVNDPETATATKILESISY
jgi:Tfp pilus assembly major pilin PilA